ncbi:unnamed protein product, partial [Coccothraustes coccothraustes]
PGGGWPRVPGPAAAPRPRGRLRARPAADRCPRLRSGRCAPRASPSATGPAPRPPAGPGGARGRGARRRQRRATGPGRQPATRAHPRPLRGCGWRTRGREPLAG